MLEAVIPRLSNDELDRLEKSVLKEGIRDALCVWHKDNDYILIDGHNRYSFAEKHDLEFQVKSYEFESELDAIDWMIQNQLGKRNLNDLQKDMLIGQRQENEKKRRGTNNQYASKSEKRQSGAFQKTAQKIADDLGVSTRTVERAGAFFRGMNKITDENLKQEILKGETNITRTRIRNIGKDKNVTEVKSLEELKTPQNMNSASAKRFDKARKELDNILKNKKKTKSKEYEPLSVKEISNDLFVYRVSKDCYIVGSGTAKEVYSNIISKLKF